MGPCSLGSQRSVPHSFCEKKPPQLDSVPSIKRQPAVAARNQNDVRDASPHRSDAGLAIVAEGAKGAVSHSLGQGAMPGAVHEIAGQHPTLAIGPLADRDKQAAVSIGNASRASDRDGLEMGTIARGVLPKITRDNQSLGIGADMLENCAMLADVLAGGIGENDSKTPPALHRARGWRGNEYYASE